MAPDNPMDIKINAKASANFDSLIKAIPKGLSRLFSLVFAKREADNARYTALMAAKTQIEYQKMIESGYDFEKDCLIPPQNNMLPANLNPLQVEERQEADNLAGNIRIAAEALKDVPDESISDKEVDNDFFARWRREAKVIGDEGLQQLWGRLLAEEVKQPGKISFRALDTLKNTTSYEAKLFQKIAPYATSNGYVVCDINRNFFPEGIGLKDLILLKECGFLMSTDHFTIGYSGGWFQLQGKKYPAMMIKNLIFSSCGNEETFKTPGIPLTTTGKAILSICDYDEPNLDQVKKISHVITSSAGHNIKHLLVYKKHKGSNYDSDQPIYDSNK